jgi:hypothetical protein
MSSGRKVDYRQPTMSQADASRGVSPNAGVVGAAVRDRVRHARADRLDSIRPCRGHKSGYTAHLTCNLLNEDEGFEEDSLQKGSDVELVKDTTSNSDTILI